MPHVIVKLWPGRSEQEKAALATEITRAVVSVLKYGDDAVSVGFEEVPPREWTEKVYKPDILSDPKRVYKKPGYNPFR